MEVGDEEEGGIFDGVDEVVVVVVGVGEKKWWPEIGGLSPESGWPEAPEEVVEVKEVLEVARVWLLVKRRKRKVK